LIGGNVTINQSNKKERKAPKIATEEYQQRTVGGFTVQCSREFPGRKKKDEMGGESKEKSRKKKKPANFHASGERSLGRRPGYKDGGAHLGYAPAKYMGQSDRAGGFLWPTWGSMGAQGGGPQQRTENLNQCG